MKKVREEAESALKQAAERMKRSYDRHARPTPDFVDGSKVYLEATNLKTDRPMKKLDDKHFGPFKIKQKVGPAAYELQLPSTVTGLLFIQSSMNRFCLLTIHPIISHSKNHLHHHH